MSTSDSLKKVTPFISSSNRIDLVSELAREHHEAVAKSVEDLVRRGLTADSGLKKDGKDGTKDGGDDVKWGGKDNTKDGKDNTKDKDKDAKESTKDKDKDAKESTKDKDKDKDKEGKDDGKEGKDVEKYVIAEAAETGEFFRYGDARALKTEIFEQIREIHSVRLNTLLSKPIF